MIFLEERDLDWLSSYVEQFVTFEIFFGTFLRSRRILFIPTWKVCRWRFFTSCSMQHEYQITLSKRSKYVTQNTHSTVVGYQRRNKYLFLSTWFWNIKKIYQPWPSRTLGATAGYGMNSHSTPRSLFAMGWSRSLSKDFIQFGKSPKKNNYLVMGSILF